MTKLTNGRSASRTMSAIGLALTLAACGGGGGGGSSRPLPTPTPTPSPAPTPTPTPTPTPVVNATEYANSDGAQQANALTAYEAGLSGEGEIVAVIDTGINPDLPDFAGRVLSRSGDVVGSRGVSDDDGHGTAVAAVAAAAADSQDMLGVAFGADILALRADEIGSCAAPDGCEFFDSDIAAGVDVAIAAGSTVINLSLGGDGVTSGLLASLQEAADAGIVIVVSAGNEGDLPEGVDPNAFALDIANGITGGVVIIAGSVGTETDPHLISDFSNRAGVGQDYYLAARGYRVRAPDNTGAQFLWSGTSFSAPVISGAVALLAEAFPSLTAAEIVEILFDSAIDLGGTGIDGVYGHGELDIAAALAPSGNTTMAGTREAVSLVDNGELPAAAGDAAAHAMSTLITDRYDRAYELNLNRTLQRAAQRRPLTQALRGTSLRNDSVDLGRIAMSVSIAPKGGSRVEFGPLFKDMGNEDLQKTRLIAGSIVARIDPETKAAFGYSEGASQLIDRLSEARGAAFLVARDGQDGPGFAAARDHSFAVRRDLGFAGLSVASETGARWSRLAEDGQEARYRLDAISLDRPTFAGGQARLGFSLLDERETLLGGRLSPALGDDGKGAQTRFLDLVIDQPLGGDLALGLSARRGWTQFGGGAFATGAYAIDVRRDRLWTADDRLAFRLSQPLRIEQGGLDLYLAQAWDYGTETATMGWQQLSLVPTGREIVGEVAYGRGALGGRLDLNAYYRRQPGHIAAADDDVGAAIRFTLGL